MKLHTQIEAILFYQAEPVTVKRLAELLKHSEEEIRNALLELEAALENTGLCLLQNNNEVTLGTNPEASTLIETIAKEELNKELSKASLETLAIVLYKGPITRAEIDYIRGVNSAFILRNLLIRGLVEKVENPKDQRSFLYKSTLALLEYMGVAKLEELPGYHDTQHTLESFMQTKMEDKEIPDPEEKKIADRKDIEKEASGGITEESESDIEADIIEEDEAGENYDDTGLREHHHLP